MSTTKDVLETMRKRNKPETVEELLFSKRDEPITQQELDEVHARAKAQEATRYYNRDRIPEHLLAFSDLYHELTQQEPVKPGDWRETFEEWTTLKLSAEHIRSAWLEANKDNDGFVVGRPGALTVTAVSVRSKIIAKPAPQIQTQAIAYTKKLVNEIYGNKIFVPRPANLPRPNFSRPERKMK